MKSIHPARGSWIAAAILALATAAAPSATPQSLGQEGDDFLITTSKTGDPLASFVAIAAALTGEPYFVDPAEVRGARIHFDGTKRVPRAKFMGFVDGCIRSAGLADVVTTVAGTRVHQLVGLAGRRGNREICTRLVSEAEIIDPSGLPRISDRGTLITTTYTCKNISGIELVRTMIQHFADPETEAVRTMRSSDILFMTGSAAHVAEMVQLCEQLDREAAGARQKAADELEKRLTALEAAVAELAPTGK